MDRNVVPVRLDGREVGSVFQARDRFFFLLEDPREARPRGPYPDEESAVTACANMAYAVGIADRWGLMVDT
jgi:hypothetical protein